MHFQKRWLDSDQTRLSLTLDGKLIFGQFEELRSFIFELKNNPPQHITFDLADVEQIDSSGLGLLIIANELTGEQKNVTLRSPNTICKNLFNVCKLEQLMVIED